MFVCIISSVEWILAGIFLQYFIVADSETNVKIPKCGTRKKFLVTWYQHQNICQPTEIILATILWLKNKLSQFFYKTNETKLIEFLKPKDRYFSFVIFYLRLQNQKWKQCGWKFAKLTQFYRLYFCKEISEKTSRVTEGHRYLPLHFLGKSLLYCKELSIKSLYYN